MGFSSLCIYTAFINVDKSSFIYSLVILIINTLIGIYIYTHHQIYNKKITFLKFKNVKDENKLSLIIDLCTAYAPISVCIFGIYIGVIYFKLKDESIIYPIIIFFILIIAILYFITALLKYKKSLK
jgi:uncharacterized membrane protein YfcA